MGSQATAPNQIISLPKGGGAQQGLGEKFSPDLHTGTGNFTVPIAVPPGRNGFQPQLNLVYSTGNGNGFFGLGWGLSIPGVTRKASKGIPRYRDYDKELKERDTFILSGAEDLVPISDPALDPSKATRYRPRTEGLFAKIIHHHYAQAGTNYWEVCSKDGLISFYGTNPADRVTYHPDFQPQTTPATISKPKLNVGDQERIFAWRLTLTKDPFGNRIEYLYENRDQSSAPDDRQGHQWDQPLLTQIRYADYQENNGTKFLVTVLFEYEDGRADPFSDYRAGFEIRTTKRCKSILIETHADRDYKVRRYEFTYRNDSLNKVSLLRAIDVVGFDDGGTEARELPPVEFGYSEFKPQDRARRDFYPIQGPDLPATSLANSSVELVDLFGNGLPDVLEMNGTIRYWRNRGNGKFDLPRPMAEAPAGLTLASVGVQLIDANGDGRTDLLVTEGALSGYYPLQFGGRWDRRSFQKYAEAPSFDLKDPEVRLIDLTGDGVTDVIRSGSRLECFFNDPHEGWKPGNTRWVERQALDVFPNVSFSDPRVKFADMTGDGMQDVVLVYDGNVEYWPNLGYGSWGKRLHMGKSPRFPYGYDPKRILLGDVDGDGLADLIYVDDRKVTLWINQNGNGWSDPIDMLGTPPVSDMDATRLVDLLGSGISGVLWTRDATSSRQDHYLFLDLTGGTKPYILHEMNNHMGAITKVGYESSTKFYLEDEKKLPTRWRTPLPFPVQVVARVEVIDEVSKGKLTTQYKYHHGYWDGDEREFRGFGMVEQFDTETFETYNTAGLHGQDVKFLQVDDRKHFSPPTLAKTWFHQGPVGEELREWEELDWSNEYWADDPQLLGHTDAVKAFLLTVDAIYQGVTTQEKRRIKRDALRTMRGSILRTELYALDGSPLQAKPYTVTEQAYRLKEIEPPGLTERDRLHIFFPHATAQRTTQWERGDDPMTSVAFTDGYDDFGQPTRQTTVALPRRSRRWSMVNGVPLDEPNILASHARTRYIDVPGVTGAPYIVDRVCETERFESAAVIPPVESNPADLRVIIADQVAAATAVHADLMAVRNLKRTGHVRNYYDGPSFVGLALGRIGNHGALTRTETLVFTDAELDAAYDIRRPAYLEGSMGLPPGAPALSTAELGYRRVVVSGVGHYYTDTLRQQVDVQAGTPGGCGLVIATRDPFDHKTHLHHDTYALFPVQVTDPVGLVTKAAYNYRVMQSERITESNDNASVMHYTPLGLPARMFLEGRDGEGGTEDDPEVRYLYDFSAHDLSGDPVSITTIQRVHHVKAGISDETIRTTDYSDGFGRQVQSRRQAERVIFGDAVFGNGVVPSTQGDAAADRQPVAGVENTSAEPNVVVSGWQRFDNKGRVVEKYEPFFDRGWDFDSLHLAPKGQAIRMRYDPRGQLIRTLNPDGSEQRVLFGIPHALNTPDDYAPTPWESYAYDANDLAPVSIAPGTNATHAPDAPTAHHYTPASTLIDAMGRSLSRIERDGTAPRNWIVTRSAYDARGNLLTITDALDRVAFRHTYDLLDRPMRVDSIDAGLRTTVLNALGAPVEYRDSKGALSLRIHADALNRITQLWAQDDGSSPLTLRENLVYGDGGSASQSTAARLAARNSNQLGRLAQHDDEAGRCSYPLYDFKGDPFEKNRQVIGDAALAAGWIPDWSQPNAAAALDPKVYQTSTRFDALNRPIDVTNPADVNGHRAVLKPVYNRAGALERVLLDGNVYVERLAYNTRGQRCLLAYGNGMVTRYAYHPRTFRLARLRTQRCQRPNALTFAPDDNVRQDYAYSYDLAGNILGIDERIDDCGIPGSADVHRLLRQFEYDPFYRLTAATGRETDAPPARPPWLETIPYNTDPTRTRGYTENYTYDRAGNILSLRRSTAGSRTYTPEVVNNRLRSMTVGGAAGVTFQYSYDPDGNMIGETTSRRFFWDHADRMKRFEEGPAGGAPTVLARYLYGAEGMRVKKWVRKGAALNDESTTYIDALFEHHLWQDAGDKQNNHLHVMDDQNRIAIVHVGDRHKDDGGEPVQYHLGDHLGGSSVVIGGASAQANTFINREEYTPYGETSFGSFGLKRYRFSGKERDEESGFSYFGARYLATWLGRWIICDLKGPKDEVNLYLFVGGGPVNYVDEEGASKVSAVEKAAKMGLDYLKKRGKQINGHIRKGHDEGVPRPLRDPDVDPHRIEQTRNRMPGQSKKLAEKTLKGYDEATQQSETRLLFEREFGRDVGRDGERVFRVVVDTRTRTIRTAFSAATFRAVAGTATAAALFSSAMAEAQDLGDMEQASFKKRTEVPILIDLLAPFEISSTGYEPDPARAQAISNRLIQDMEEEQGVTLNGQIREELKNMIADAYYGYGSNDIAQPPASLDTAGSDMETGQSTISHMEPSTGVFSAIKRGQI